MLLGMLQCWFRIALKGLLCLGAYLKIMMESYGRLNLELEELYGTVLISYYSLEIWCLIVYPSPIPASAKKRPVEARRYKRDKQILRLNSPYRQLHSAISDLDTGNPHTARSSMSLWILNLLAVKPYWLPC